jgi:hypothetical protein
MPIAESERGGCGILAATCPIEMSLLMVNPNGTAVPIGSGLAL